MRSSSEKLRALADKSSAIALALQDGGHTRETFASAFPPLFEKHYGRPFDVSDAHDLMLAEGVFSEVFG